jgi:hypothetical protein
MIMDGGPTRVAPYRSPAAFVERVKDREAEWNGQPHHDFCVRLLSNEGVLHVSVSGSWPQVYLYSAQQGNGWEPVTNVDGKPTGDILIHGERGAIECLGVPTGPPPSPFDRNP